MKLPPLPPRIPLSINMLMEQKFGAILIPHPYASVELVAFDGNLILPKTPQKVTRFIPFPTYPLPPKLSLTDEVRLSWRDLQGGEVSGLPLGSPHQSVLRCSGPVGELRQRPAYQGGIYLLTVQIVSHQIGSLPSPIPGRRVEVTDRSVAYLTSHKQDLKEGSSLRSAHLGGI